MNNNLSDDVLKIFEEFVEDYVPPEKTEEKPIESKKHEEKSVQSEEEMEKQAWIKSAKEKREEAFRAISAQASKVFKKRTSLIDFLTVQAHFDRYPVRNCLLITSQLPGATRLKSFDDWGNEGRKIKKGAKAVTILEPGDEYIRADGSVGRYYNTRALFDVSQVTGGKFEQPLKEEKSIAEKLKILFSVIKTLDIKPCSFGEDGGRAAFYQKNNNAVYVNKSIGIDTLYPQLCVELAHMIIAHEHKDYTRKKYGSMCEMIGYMLCVRTNVSVAENAVPLRIAPEYEQFKEKEVIKTLDEIRQTANSISTLMRKLAED